MLPLSEICYKCYAVIGAKPFLDFISLQFSLPGEQAGRHSHTASPGVMKVDPIAIGSQ